MNSKSKKGTKVSNENAFLVSDVGIQRNFEKVIIVEGKGADGKDAKKILHNLPKGGVFPHYEELEQIAENIAKDFLQDKVFKKPDEDFANMTYKDIINKGLTYFMSSGKESGLLSICPAVLTAMKLWRELAVTKEKSKIKRETSIRKELMTHIRMGIDAILKIVYRDDKHEQNDDAPVFDASPFEYDENTFTKGLDNGRSYIDSISWAVPVFLRILNLIGKDGSPAFTDKDDKSLLEQAKFLAKWCLKYTNESVIWDKDRDIPTPIGWNYTKLKKQEGAERSLNFTYAASTVYLSFYAEYEEIIEALRTLDRVKELTKDDKIKIEFSGKYWENHNNLEEELKRVEAFLEDIAKEESTVDGESRDSKENKERSNMIAKFEKIRDALGALCKSENIEKLETFIAFNDGKQITDEPKIKDTKDAKSTKNTKEIRVDHMGAVSRLKWSLEQVSADIWEQIGEKIEDQFFYDDQKLTVADNAAIASGGQTNALFSGLLSIGIMLNAAYDIKIKNDKGDKAYGRMQDAMLLHVQKTQRFFDDLEEDGNAFGVDTLILRFSQKINDADDVVEEQDTDGLSDKALAEQLRKHYIRVNSLTPLLLKTNNILSKYVIKYPQKQMGESLLQISKKRVRDNKTNKIWWLWESDGYNAVATYYYVDGIINFYDYYETYEKLYIRNYEDMREAFIIDAKYEAGVRKHCESVQKKFEEEKGKYTKEIRDKESDIERLKKELKQNSVGNDLVDVLHRTITEFQYFDSPEFYKRLLNGMRKCLATELIKKYEALLPPENEKSLEQLKTSAVLDIKEENINKNGEVFSLLQALIVDVILPSAIADKREGGGTVELGVMSTEMKNKMSMSADFVLEGRKLLLDDNKVNELFANMFGAINW